MELYYKNKNINSIMNAMPMFRESEFQSPLRSTIPLLSWLLHEETMVKSLLNDLGIIDAYHCYLEYEVSPPLGRGTASHTDLMVISYAGRDSSL